MFWKGGEALTPLDSFVVKLWPQTSQRPSGTWATVWDIPGVCHRHGQSPLVKEVVVSLWPMCCSLSVTQKRKQCYALRDSSKSVVLTFQRAGCVVMVSLFEISGITFLWFAADKKNTDLFCQWWILVEIWNMIWNVYNYPMLRYKSLLRNSVIG